ncbi:MAG: hypothetical protein MJ072_02520 [Clostridia bacterium]|nr:hypothetical protein [Clostridia bacterium]
MPEKEVSMKIRKAFTRTFANKKFDADAFKQEYTALFFDTVNELSGIKGIDGDKKGNVADFLKDRENVKRVFDEIEPHVKKLLKEKGIKYDESVAFGGLTDDEKELLTDKATFGDFSQETSAEEKDGKKGKKKFKKRIAELFGIKEKKDDKSEKKPENDKQKEKDPELEKKEAFAKIYDVSQKKFKGINEKNKDEACKYIRGFDLKKKDCLKDAVAFVLSDKKPSTVKTDPKKEDKIKKAASKPNFKPYDIYNPTSNLPYRCIYYYAFLEKNDLFGPDLKEVIKSFRDENSAVNDAVNRERVEIDMEDELDRNSVLTAPSAPEQPERDDTRETVFDLSKIEDVGLTDETDFGRPCVYEPPSEEELSDKK